MSDIFENEDEVMENIYESAEALGTSIRKRNIPIAVPKSDCKLCYGRGVVSHSFPGNHGFCSTEEIRCKCVKIKYVR